MIMLNEHMTIKDTERVVSNIIEYVCKAVKKIEDYPIGEFLNAGLLVSVNTDNRTVSRTSLSRELELLQKNWGIQKEQIFLLMKSGVQTAFADDALKDKLYKKIIHGFQKVI